MKNKFKIAFWYLLMCFLLFGVNYTSFSQELENIISAKLSSGERKKMDKAIEMKQKGLSLALEASNEQAQTIIKSDLEQKKADKKFALKRIAASNIYSNAIEIKYDILKGTLKNFWKLYKGDKHTLTLLKSLELTSLDSLKKSLDNRSKTTRIIKTSDRLNRTLTDEASLDKFILILEKVVYGYWNLPKEIDQQWFLSKDDHLPLSGNIAQDSPTIAKIDTSLSVADTVQSEKHDSIATVSTATEQEKILQTTFNRPDNNGRSTFPPPVVQTIKTTVVPEVVVTAPKKNAVKDSITQVKSDSIAASPANYQSNDSSLYGKVKVNEDEVDQFNGFLKKKFPDKYEDFVINFQSLDYSDVEGLKKSWYKYRYGSSLGDSAITLASIKKQKRDTTNVAFAIKDTSNVIIGSEKQLQAAVTNNNTEKTTSNKANKIAAVKDKKAKQVAVKTKDKSTESTANKTITATKSSVPISSVVNEKMALHDSITSDFVFHVQIVACRSKLSLKEVRSMNHGNDSIMEFYEDNWYKYAVGKYNTYREARLKRDALKIQGAFVIAYLHGKRIKISPAIAYKKRSATNLNTKN